MMKKRDIAVEAGRSPAVKRRGPAVSRRRLLETGCKVTFGAIVAAAVFRGPLRRALAKVVFPDPDYKPLDGACIEPRTDSERMVAAIVDTVVPGAESDPAGVPGAVECCSVNLVHDAFYPIAAKLDLILRAVDNMARKTYGKTFVELAIEERTEVLRKTEEDIPFIRLLYRFIRSAFYGMSYTMRGTVYMKWAGPNLGYRDHEDFSFRKPLSDEMTEDGNLP